MIYFSKSECKVFSENSSYFHATKNLEKIKTFHLYQIKRAETFRRFLPFYKILAYQFSRVYE